MTTSEINNYDVQLIKYLSRGISQENIETVFKQEDCSLIVSFIEKTYQ
jgi:hypothetical protein